MISRIIGCNVANGIFAQLIRYEGAVLHQNVTHRTVKYVFIYNGSRDFHIRIKEIFRFAREYLVLRTKQGIRGFRFFPQIHRKLRCNAIYNIFFTQGNPCNLVEDDLTALRIHVGKGNLQICLTAVKAVPNVPPENNGVVKINHQALRAITGRIYSFFRRIVIQLNGIIRISVLRFRAEAADNRRSVNIFRLPIRGSCRIIVIIPARRLTVCRAIDKHNVLRRSAVGVSVCNGNSKIRSAVLGIRQR